MNAASRALDATQLILSSRLSSKVSPTKHNYSFLRQNIVILFLERKETYTRWHRIRDSTFMREMTFRFHRLQPIVRDSLRGVRLSRLKKVAQPTYIDTYIYVRMCVCMCVYVYVTRVSLLFHCFVFWLLPSLFFFFFLCGYVRIIATNISHRPTFRSTTQHNHCRISLRFFLLFFIFSPFFLTSDRFPHR